MPDDGEDFAHARVVRRRLGGLPILLVGAAVLALGWFALASTSNNEDSAGTTSTSPEPSTPAATSATTIVRPPTSAPGAAAGAPLTPVDKPVLRGWLDDGRPYEVREAGITVLCARISDVPAQALADTTSTEVCHNELETASGARFHEDTLAFGYLAPGSTGVALRYRQSGRSSEGLLTDPLGRFFAMPITNDDLYRIQYVNDSVGVLLERPLVPPRGSPSQSPEAAASDGVAPVLAALPFNRRVDIVIENTFGDEGAWAVSQFVEPVESAACEESSDNGDDGAIDACSTSSFEVLLLDARGTAIQQAFPLPGVTPRELWLFDDAVYVAGRAGVDNELDENESFLARIDRMNRSFVLATFPGTRIDDLDLTPDDVLTVNFNGGLTLDPRTLEPLR